MAMDLCERGSLQARIDHLGAFSVDETLDIGEKIASALQAAHEAGVLHRDIKPSNILLSQYGPALTDFGIARSSDAVEWTESLLQLTVNHAAPETFIDTQPTVQGDIYSLGSTLFTMLAGRPPFALRVGETPMQFVVRLEREDIPPLRRSDVDAPLRSVLERCLAKRPEDRFATAAELERALRSAAAPNARAPLPGAVPTHGVVSALPRLSSPPAPPLVPPASPTVVRPSEQPVAATTVSRSPRPAQPPVRPAPTRPSATTARSSFWAIGWTVAGLVLLLLLCAGAIVYFSTTSDTDPVDETTGATTNVGAPRNVQATFTDGTATLTWDDGSGGEASQFVVIPIDSDNNRLDATQATTTEATIGGLDPSKSYCFIVVAVIGDERAVDDATSHGCTDGATLETSEP
jgi:serine/threonine protein kinase